MKGIMGKLLVSVVKHSVKSARAWRQRRHMEKLLGQRKLINEMDNMNGTEFEEFLDVVFTRMGYRVRHMGKSGDYGVDLVLEKQYRNEDNKFSSRKLRIAVQAKRYRNNVGNKAVQEVYSGMAMYKCNAGWVVTNSGFTRAAIEQAEGCGVRLVDRQKLLRMVASTIHDHS